MIQGIVDDRIQVALGKVGGPECASSRGCYLSGKITLNQEDLSGTLAVTIVHEYRHSTQRHFTTAGGYARNELDAWDAAQPVFDNLQGAYAEQARTAYGIQYQILSSMDGRVAALRYWTEKAKQRFGVPF